MALDYQGLTPTPAAPGDTDSAGTTPSDAELIAAVRGGDRAAFAELYARHAPAAKIVARQYAPRPADAEDIVSETFARVFRLLGEGKGPDSFFRAYVFTAVRHLAATYGQASGRVDLSDDDSVFEGGLNGVQEDPSESLIDQQIVREAFASLPERWRTALWYAEVEGLTTSQMAPSLGLTPNGVAALLYRAREGLRQAYLQQHLAKPLDQECRTISGRLGAFARGALGQRERSRVAAHIDVCARCRSVAAEVHDVNKGLRGVIAPLVLGAGAGLPSLMSAIGAAPPLPSAVSASLAGAGAAASAGAGGGAAGSGAATSVAGGMGAAAPAVPAGVGAAGSAAGSAASLPVAAGSLAGHGAMIAIPVAAKSGATGAMALTGIAVVAVVAGGIVLSTQSDPPQAPAPIVVTSAAAPTELEQSAAPARTTAPVTPSDGDTMPLVFTADGPVDVALAGAPLPPCELADASADCPPASSATQITLPNGAEVRYATLAWATSSPGENWSDATLIAPDGTAHPVRATAHNELLVGDQATADVTGIVSLGASGTWTLADADVASGEDFFAGWTLTVAYTAPGLPERRVSIYQGALRVAAGNGKEVDVDAPTGTADSLGLVAWGAHPGRIGSDLWMSAGRGEDAVAQELLANPFHGTATGFAGPPTAGTDVLNLDGGVVFPRVDKAGSTVTLGVRAWGDPEESDPFTLGAVALVTGLPPE
jgi:RNA polymerase sigma factor (sigma-70 family)